MVDSVDDAVSTLMIIFFFQAEDGIRDLTVTGVQTCALPILVRVDAIGVPPVEVLGRGPDARRTQLGAGAEPQRLDQRRQADEQAQRRHELDRSEEHTSELQSQSNLVCRLLLEKKKEKSTCHNSPTNRRDAGTMRYQTHGSTSLNEKREQIERMRRHHSTNRHTHIEPK